MSCEAASLLRALLQREAPKRLGYGPQGSDNVKAHPFFRPVNWSRLMARQMPSPFRPSVNHVDRCVPWSAAACLAVPCCPSGPAVVRHCMTATLSGEALSTTVGVLTTCIVVACSVENFDKIWTDLAPEDSPCGTPPGQEYSAFQVHSTPDCLPAGGPFHSSHMLLRERLLCVQGFTYCAPSYLEEIAAAASARHSS